MSDLTENGSHGRSFALFPTSDRPQIVGFQNEERSVRNSVSFATFLAELKKVLVAILTAIVNAASGFSGGMSELDVVSAVLRSHVSIKSSSIRAVSLFRESQFPRVFFQIG